jgi:hypothetical protein
LFKKDGEKLAGPFNSLFVTDQGVYNFFIARDFNVCGDSAIKLMK